MNGLKISVEELSFIREAITEKYEGIMNQLVFPEERPNSFGITEMPSQEELNNMLGKALDKFDNQFTLSAPRVQVMKQAGVWKSKTKRNKMIAAYKKNDAPYGLKKDGTPAKKRGRKTT